MIMMVKKIYGYTTWIIQNLTNDEDIQQELWLYILEGNSIFTLQDQYNKIINTMENIDGLEEII